jgi:hypothetical protein
MNNEEYWRCRHKKLYIEGTQQIWGQGQIQGGGGSIRRRQEREKQSELILRRRRRRRRG